jgi:hypothetical protein
MVMQLQKLEIVPTLIVWDTGPRSASSEKSSPKPISCRNPTNGSFPHQVEPTFYTFALSANATKATLLVANLQLIQLPSLVPASEDELAQAGFNFLSNLD